VYEILNDGSVFLEEVLLAGGVLGLAPWDWTPPGVPKNTKRENV